jgi:hypothetical protein
MTLDNLIKIFSDKGCKTAYVKSLGRNNNSKQQIYVAKGDIEILNVFPLGDFQAVLKGNAKNKTFHASCVFYWLNDQGNKFKAPNAKFILYPKYPEVRFSGFIQGCVNAPSEILNDVESERLLFFGVSDMGEIFGYVVNSYQDVYRDFFSLNNVPKVGILYSISIYSRRILLDTKFQLLSKLKAIYLKGWINSKQLKPGFKEVPCNESRCGGLTLEAELGIIQNGKSEPDFLGWEIKQFGIRKPHLLNASKITLMTPEPDGGLYGVKGGIEFVKKYGYLSPTTAERMDFTGNHLSGKVHKKTGLIMRIEGFDSSSNRIANASGGIYLIDQRDNIAASWSFAKLLTHWNKKHSKAAYIPSLSILQPVRQYKYSNNVVLGIGTDFNFFLKIFLEGKIYYDPGIHIDNIAIKPKLKPRSQFRITSRFIQELYSIIERVDLDNV